MPIFGDYLNPRNFILAGAITAAVLGGCGEPVKISKVQRYSGREAITLNRLEVYWGENENCGKLNPRYGYTTANIVGNNVHSALRRYPADDVFRQGFVYSPDPYDMPDMTVGRYVWKFKEPFVRESAEDPETLRQIGQDIYENAFNDPAEKASAQ
ncbi:MAG: hypothetical protein HYW27_04345 [Candidatus Aenigmarchaeota archaeon]|nr:hypothetical protein [Candidatus Aenigmarchaeota archaeon]